MKSTCVQCISIIKIHQRGTGSFLQTNLQHEKFSYIHVSRRSGKLAKLSPAHLKVKIEYLRGQQARTQTFQQGGSTFDHNPS